MGKSKGGGGGGGSSWFSAVKKAFRSPTKDTTSTTQNNKKNSRKSRDDTNEQEQDEDEKKREKRRWLFRKHSSSSNNHNSASQKIDQSNNKLRKFSTAPPPPSNKTAAAESVDHRHAIAVAAATAAAAEAAVATAQAAVEIIRLTRPSSASNPPTSIKQQQQHYAAITIQKAFRGYLARRALVALRGIVKLQAVIRGQNVRKQAQMTLRCMQALLRLQTRMQHHPHHEKRLSQDGDGNVGGRSRKSMFAESNTNSFFWDSKSVPERKSMSTRDRRGSVSSIDWNWNWNDDCPRTLEELEERLQSRKEAAAAAAAALQRETTSSSSSSLAYAFSQKIWNNTEENEDIAVEAQRTNWLEQWMETKQLGNSRRFSTDHKRDSFVKTVEMDTNHNHNVNMTTPKRYSASLASSPPANNVRKMRQQSPHSAAPSACPSPGRGLKTGVQAPSTPSPLSKAKPAGTTPMRTPSPRSYSAANTPSLRSIQRLNTASAGPRLSSAGNNGYVPNYMAATASAKARVRSQSAPRQRPSTPEREYRSGAGSGSAAFAKKRLSFPVPPSPIREGCEHYSNSDSRNYYSQNLRSPSFKSMQAGYVGMEQQSCYTESINGGEISPCSTTELRWWFR